MIYEPTAWYSYVQFTEIFSRLSDVNEYERILFQIELWKAHGRVPAAVHATYFLLNVILCDRRSQVYDSNIQDLYAMSIIKTVNLLLDQEQDSLYAKSMLLMGKEANLPENIIKVRHRCSHGDIPDVESLRLVSREAVNYLYRKYWENQCNQVKMRLNDEHYYAFLLYLIFMHSRCGFLSVQRPRSRPLKTPKRVRRPASSLKRLAMTVDFRNLVEVDCKILLLRATRRHLSLGRRLALKRRKKATGPNRMALELYNTVSKKLLASCIHEDLLISVLVEGIFAVYTPAQSHMFFPFLFYTISQYSFNFTIRLVNHMLNIILGHSDVLSDPHSFAKDSVSARVKLYSQVLVDPEQSNGYDSEVAGHSWGHDPEMHVNRVNEWLLALLEYSLSLKHRRFSQLHLRHLEMVNSLSHLERSSILRNELTALSRILSSATLLLPILILKVPNHTPKQPAGWKQDKLSHLISISNWLKAGNGKYTFTFLEEGTKRDTLAEFRSHLEQNTLNLNKNLLPGTFWDDQQSKVAETYPLSDTEWTRTDARIKLALERIRADNFTRETEIQRRGARLESQMRNLNMSLKSERVNLVRIQKKMLRLLQHKP